MQFHNPFLCITVELYLIGDLHLALRPFVGKIHELYLTQINQTELDLYLFVLFHNSFCSK